MFTSGIQRPATENGELLVGPSNRKSEAFVVVVCVRVPADRGAGFVMVACADTGCVDGCS